MTIADNLTALTNQKLGYQDSVEACKTSLANKDVVVPVGAKLADISGLIDEIEQGIDTSDATATAADLIYGKTAYVNGAKITGEGAMWQYVYSTGQSQNPIFSYSPIVNCELYLPNATSTYNLFLECTNLTNVHIISLAVLGGLTHARNMFRGCVNLQTISGEPINCSQITSFNLEFLNCYKLETVKFLKNSIKAPALSFLQSPLLTTESLISIANGLNSTTPNVLTMHPTSKTNMNSIMVDNVAGEAVLGSAMTLTQFITNIKTWTIA